MKNSRGWSPTWPSVGGGTAGGGEAGAPPHPPLPRAPRRPRPRPIPLPLTAGSTATSSWEGGARCRAETLVATVEAPARPLAIAEERKKPRWKEADGERLRSAVPPPLLIKGRGRGSAAPLNQSGHQEREESRPTRGSNQQRPGFPPRHSRPAPTAYHLQGMGDTWRENRNRGDE